MFVWREPAFVHRKVNQNKELKTIYLTFDDGPSPIGTEDVLALLKKYEMKATFFVIGTSAELYPDLIRKMIADGHSIQSHSIDHKYMNYFKSSCALEQWILFSLEHLKKITGQNIKYFRPPAGILTPPLLASCEKLNVPVVLWNHRFFDAVQPLKKKSIEKNIFHLKSGDIILLHDRQKLKNKKQFLESLDYFLSELQRLGFKSQTLKL